ncbi:hypothetical protein JCM19235_3473 [Vibrio maritimus]|uniref:DUF1989 domain-containing protein n=1 Tax=Vibrio maritimus TaxID=990268 RepID=A0A090RYW2_9VIBR|nr:hypothetical protein JCM19235_3473 [Vibrio maritimus]
MCNNHAKHDYQPLPGEDAHLAITESPQFKFNQEHYDNIIEQKPNRKLVYKEILEAHTGDAFLVKKGQVIRAEQINDKGIAQILDWNIVSPDLTEYLSYGHSAPLEGPYLKKYTRCWSNTGHLHPMATMVADEVPDYFAEEGWSNHFWMFHCNPAWNEAAAPSLHTGHDSCHTNFMHGFSRIPAIHALPEAEKRRTIEFLADQCNFMTFQVFRTGWDEEAQDVMMDLRPGPNIPKGTGVEFYAEQDCYFVISSCPWADMQGNLEDVEPQPVEISVWDTGIEPLPRPQWRDWKSEFYFQLSNGVRNNTPRTEESYNYVTESNETEK